MISLLLALSDPEGTQHKPLPLPGDGFSWREWLDEAQWHGVLPIVSKHLEANSGNPAFPPWVREEAASSYSAAWGRNMFLESMLEEAAQALAQRNIQAIVLKGPALAEQVYPEMGLRPFTDIDLLIPREAAATSWRLFQGQGFQPDFSEYEFCAENGLAKVCFSKKVEGVPASFELHWDVVNSPSFRRRCSIGFSDLAPDAQPWSACPALLYPCPEDLLLTCLIHLAVGHQFDRVILFVDVLQILRRNRKKFDWEKFFCKAERCGAGRLSASTLMLANDLFPLPAPREIACEIRRRLGAPWIWRLVLTGRQAVAPPSPVKWLRLHLYREMIKRTGRKKGSA